MSKTIVVKAPANPPLEQIAAAARDRPVYEINDLTETACQEQGVDPRAVGAVLGGSPQDDFSVFPELQWIHSATAGVDSWLAADAVPEHTILTSATGNGAIPLAEHAMLLMLMLNRDAPRWFRAQQQHTWDRFVHGELAGATLGIVGYGNSGRDLARKAEAFHMHVQALRYAYPEGDDGDVRLLHGPEGLRTLLTTSDFVVVTAPLTQQTEGLIGEEELSWMRPDSSLIVVSRGGIVEHDALIRTLEAGKLAGAGLDAHSIEPLPADSPLWAMPRVIVTPHNGATTAATAKRGRAIVLDNVERWATGQPLHNVVDPHRGY